MNATEIDSYRFRRALGHFATGVTVITVEHAGDLHGMTANTFTSVSLDPPLVLFCVAKSARMARMLDAVPGFAVSILSDAQEAVSRQFAGGTKDRAPEQLSIALGPVAPYVADALVALSCVTESIHDAGDHWIVVGRVVELHDEPRAARTAPLVFYRSRYAHLVERDLRTTLPSETWSNDAIRIYHDEWDADDTPDEEPESPW